MCQKNIIKWGVVIVPVNLTPSRHLVSTHLGARTLCCLMKCFCPQPDALSLPKIHFHVSQYGHDLVRINFASLLAYNDTFKNVFNHPKTKEINCIHMNENLRYIWLLTATICPHCSRCKQSYGHHQHWIQLQYAKGLILGVHSSFSMLKS